MKLTRREMLEVVGITAGSCALSSCAVDKLATFSDGAEKPDFPWTYTELEPDITAQRAYHIYEKGRCMYGVFASVILQLAKEHGEPYRSFPVDMMRYGGGGTAGWGSLCGALNGSAALIGL
ncbi:MAG: C-GCAxxG-C-C family protein, partial [Planctomycetota bacterium]